MNAGRSRVCSRVSRSGRDDRMTSILSDAVSAPRGAVARSNWLSLAQLLLLLLLIRWITLMMMMMMEVSR